MSPCQPNSYLHFLYLSISYLLFIFLSIYLSFIFLPPQFLSYRSSLPFSTFLVSSSFHPLSLSFSSNLGCLSLPLDVLSISIYCSLPGSTFYPSCISLPLADTGLISTLLLSITYLLAHSLPSNYLKISFFLLPCSLWLYIHPYDTSYSSFYPLSISYCILSFSTSFFHP
jgi:hypothetical protein